MAALHSSLTTDLAVVLVVSSALLLAAREGFACDGPRSVREVTPTELRAWFDAQHATVLTFAGYSGAGYEDPRSMLDEVGRELDAADPDTTIVNIGATADGIGAAYEVAKRRGFRTTGVVSTQARDGKVALSPCVDEVFYVRDATWGGLLPGSAELSPTSEAMVGVSSRFVAIGGGEVTRDEFLAARRQGKDARFVAADMNHAIAIDKATKRGAPPPTSFAGAAGEALGPGRP